MTTSLHLRINSARLKSDFDTLSEIGATLAGGISRLALSNEDLEARAWFANRVEEAGFMVRDDEVGNLSSVLYSPSAEVTLLVGSHLDTVLNGGRYDGAIGILAGLECQRTLAEAGVELPFHLEVIDFTDEEGWWQSFFGSMGLTGTLREIHVNDREQDNAAFRAALFRAGIRPAEVQRAARDPQNLLGYLELHIEQGPRLETNACDIGIVTRIIGRSTYLVTFFGEPAHSTTSVEHRRDALQGAAHFITRIHNLRTDEFPDGFVNCGNITVKPGTFNVIPSEAHLRVECRHEDEATLAEMESRIVRIAQECAREFRLSVSSQRAIHRPVAHMAPHLIRAIDTVCRREGLKTMSLASYAGHDAQILAPFIPSAMIFIPSANGISHNPKEFTDWHHIEQGANVLLQSILHLAGR